MLSAAQALIFERLPYADFIRRYDRDGALFYLYPSRPACEIKDSFLMSLNDNEGVRETFVRFHIISVETAYKIIGKVGRVSGLLISNYPLPANDD